MRNVSAYLTDDGQFFQEKQVVEIWIQDVPLSETLTK